MNVYVYDSNQPLAAIDGNQPILPSPTILASAADDLHRHPYPFGLEAPGRKSDSALLLVSPMALLTQVPARPVPETRPVV